MAVGNNNSLEVVVKTTSDTRGIKETEAELGKLETAVKKNTTSTGQLAGAVAVGNAAYGTISATLSSFTGFVGESITAANRYQGTLIGLSTVARAFGVDQDTATDAAKRLAADGFMTVTDAAQGLKNLLSSGFSLPQAIQLMESLKNQSAFNRQSFYDLGGAVVATTEGIKNGNSVLADATGTTKNLSIMAKEAGVGIDEMGSIAQNAGYRQAVFNGFMQDASRSMGDLTRLSGTAAGADAQLAASKLQLQQRVGALANAIRQPLTLALSNFVANNQQAIVSIGAGAVAAGVFAGGLFLAIKAIQAFSLASAIAAASNPLILALTALGALAGVVVYRAVGKMQGALAKSQETSEGLGGTLGSAVPAGAGKASKAMQDLAKKLTDIDEQSVKAQRDFRESLAQMVKDHQDKVSDLQKQLNTENANYTQANDRQAADFAATQKDMADEHQKRVDKIQLQLDSELALGKWADQSKVRDLQERLATENDEYNKDLADKQAKYTQDVAENKAAHDQKTLDLQTQLDSENALLSKHAADVSAIRNVTLLDEIDKLKRSHDEQLVAFQKQKDDAIANAQQTADGVGGVWNNANAGLNDQFSKMGNQMGTAMANAFKQALGDSFKDIWSSIVKTVKDKAKNANVLDFKSAPNAFEIFDSIGNAIKGRASGGSIQAGNPYIVGEEGPELVIPSQSGTVIPARQTASVLGGSAATATGGVTIYQTNHNYSQFDLNVANRELGWKLQMKAA